MTWARRFFSIADHAQADSEAPFPPVLKGPYSTGRGGAANVMHNDAGPHVARIAQDLEGPDRQTADTRMMSPMQYAGRGGAGNIIKSREASRSRSRTRGPNESKDGEGSEHSQALSERIKHVFEKVK